MMRFHICWTLVSFALLKQNHLVKGLKCFTCLDASSNDECNTNGSLVECASNEKSCQNEVRLSEGNQYRITKRCKQTLACENNQEQNPSPAWDPIQCNPAFTTNSVCRCCCHEDYCNEAAMPCEDNPQCPAPEKPTDGDVKCNNMNFQYSVCTFSCDRGFELVGDSETMCSQSEGDLNWDAEAPKCRRAKCSAAEPADPENGRVKCSDSSNAGSQCIFGCDSGYELQGEFQTACSLNGEWSSSFPKCKKVECDPSHAETLINGEVSCSDGINYLSVCDYSCSDGYELVGALGVMCQTNKQWTTQKPECQRITCAPNGISIAHGQSYCTDKNYYGSECTFECEPGYFLQGEQLTTCRDFQWSNPSPICLRESCQPILAAPVDGSVSCSEGSLSFSVCDYICGDGSDKWELYGVEESTCQLNGETTSFEWSNTTAPCCARRCPPYARVDLFLVLDSSSSVGRENWNKTVYFIKDIIDQFIISPDDVLVAAIRDENKRAYVFDKYYEGQAFGKLGQWTCSLQLCVMYNRFVDTVSEIKIGQYTTREATTDAIINLPYDGSGTFTGNALDYVLNQMLVAPLNRPNIEDLVLVVTDGISSDDVITPARKLREAGTKVLALGVVNAGGSLKREDIADIAGDPESAVLIESGFEGLSLNVTGLINKKVCGKNPCIE